MEPVGIADLETGAAAAASVAEPAGVVEALEAVAAEAGGDKSNLLRIIQIYLLAGISEALISRTLIYLPFLFSNRLI